MTAYRTTEYYDESAQDTSRVNRSDWYGVDEKRMVEYMAAQLVDHDYQSSVVWIIIEQRQSGWRHAQEAYELALRRVYSTYVFFSSHFKGLSKAVHIDATARRLGMSTRSVYEALRDAELFRLPELVREVA